MSPRTVGGIVGGALQVVAPVFAWVALARHVDDRFVAIALSINTLAFVVVAFGLWSLYASDHFSETGESVTDPLTGHDVAGGICSRCETFSDEEVDYHLSGHVLITDGCAVCEHIREGRDA